MFTRNINDQNRLIGYQPYTSRIGQINLYPNAFPFDRAKMGSPSPVAYAAIQGQAAGVTTQVDIWNQNIVRTLPAVGFTFGVSSSSAADASAGTGAQTIEVDVLDTQYRAYTFTVTLNGQTKVTDTNLVGTCFRINDVRVKTTGSGKANAGVIYIYDSSDTVTAGVPQTSTKIFQIVNTGENVTKSGFYTVPAGVQAQLQQFRWGFYDTTNAARAGTVALYRIGADGIPVYLPVGGQDQGSGIITANPDNPIFVDEKTDLTIRGTASASSTLIAYMDLILYMKV